MSEQESINRAYAETVETIFKVFFGAFTSAAGSPDAEQAAKDRFQNGIAHARHVRDLGPSSHSLSDMWYSPASKRNWRGVEQKPRPRMSDRYALFPHTLPSR
jgi:hypothetical protein